MAEKFGRRYELTIYPANYMQTSVPGTSIVDIVKDQAAQLSAVLLTLQSTSSISISSLNDIKSRTNQLINISKSLQSIVSIPNSIIDGLKTGIGAQVTNLIANVTNSSLIPASFINDFKSSAQAQINNLTQYIPQIPAAFTSFNTFDTGNNANIITIKNPFTMTFNIRRAALSTANFGTFQIYNLGQTTRDQLYKDQTSKLTIRRMTLKAGYSDPLPIIFDGNIKWCTSYRGQGQTNYITEIEAYDWEFPMTNAHTSKSFSGTVSKDDVINQLVKDMISQSNGGVTAGYIRKYPDTIYNPTLDGNTWNILKDYTDNTCFIDNGRLNILNEDECYNSSLTEISSQTGLLGAPKRSLTYTLAEMLFEPSLVVGQAVNLFTESQKMLNGAYKVYAINHIGIISDAVGGKCQSNVSLFSFNKTSELIQLSGSLS